jgi:signal recognition particle subunit SRP72
LNSSQSEGLAAAGEIFSSLRKLNPNNRVAIAGFIASNATHNFSAIQSDLDKLTSVDRLISGIDAVALEGGGIASIPVTVTDASRKRTAPVEKEKPQKNKRIRRSKMPKDFEEGKKMDPERWLPMRDRSSYRPKGKKGKKKAPDMTQGGMVREEESLELVGGAGAVKVEKASVGGGGGGKAKKKKTKK